MNKQNTDILLLAGLCVFAVGIRCGAKLRKKFMEDKQIHRDILDQFCEACESGDDDVEVYWYE